MRCRPERAWYDYIPDADTEHRFRIAQEIRPVDRTVLPYRGSRSAHHGQRARDYAPGRRCHRAQVPAAARPGNTVEHRLEQGRLVADGPQVDLRGRHADEKGRSCQAHPT